MRGAHDSGSSRASEPSELADREEPSAIIAARMTTSRKVMLAWLLSGGAAMVAFAAGEDRPVLWMLAGAIVAAWGVAVAANIRGLADAFPRRFGGRGIWQETSPGMIRLIFGFFVVWGAMVFAIGTSRLVD